MGAIRTCLRANRLAIVLFLALALSVKLLVPQGFMLGEAAGARYLTVQLCDDGISHQTTRIAIPAEGDPHQGHGQPDQHCPFTALAMGALGAGDPAVAERATVVPGLHDIPATSHWHGRSINLPPPSRGPPASV
ncbi:MAG: hypothetical protein J0G94_06200 [Sphingomonadales bacterium]|mgnify:CR=1 FL=1|nr:hypothetical protein [Sphingomonadales bacterium]